MRLGGGVETEPRASGRRSVRRPRHGFVMTFFRSLRALRATTVRSGSDRGATAIEYALLVAGVAIVMLVGVAFLGSSIGAGVASAAGAMTTGAGSTGETGPGRCGAGCGRAGRGGAGSGGAGSSEQAAAEQAAAEQAAAESALSRRPALPLRGQPRQRGLLLSRLPRLRRHGLLPSRLPRLRRHGLLLSRLPRLRRHGSLPSRLRPSGRAARQAPSTTTARARRGTSTGPPSSAIRLTAPGSARPDSSFSPRTPRRPVRRSDGPSPRGRACSRPRGRPSPPWARPQR